MHLLSSVLVILLPSAHWKSSWNSFWFETNPWCKTSINIFFQIKYIHLSFFSVFFKSQKPAWPACTTMIRPIVRFWQTDWKTCTTKCCLIVGPSAVPSTIKILPEPGRKRVYALYYQASSSACHLYICHSAGGLHWSRTSARAYNQDLVADPPLDYFSARILENKHYT